MVSCSIFENKFLAFCTKNIVKRLIFQAESDIESDTSVFDVKSPQGDSVTSGGRRRSSSVVNNNNNNNNNNSRGGELTSPEAPPLPIRSTSERNNVTSSNMS